MFTKKCLDIIYQTLSGDTPYQRVLEDKFPTKNSEEKSPKQFRKKTSSKEILFVFFSVLFGRDFSSDLFLFAQVSL